jgi:hypothetical protein
MSNEKYQGYTNYETWCVCLEDIGSNYNYWREVAAEVFTNAEADNTFTKSDIARCTLEYLMWEHVTEENFPVVPGVYATLLNAALSKVNWYELADSALEEVEGYENSSVITTFNIENQ